MTALTRPFRRLLGRSAPDPTPVRRLPRPSAPVEQPGVAVDIPETDPLLAYLQSAPGPVDVARLELDSPGARRAARAPASPSSSRSSPRASSSARSTWGRASPSRTTPPTIAASSTTLAAQAAPAIRVAQLVREQAAEAAERERLEQELQGRDSSSSSSSSRASCRTCPSGRSPRTTARRASVGGDFYDFIELPDGRIGVVVGDVTDKGVPAALVMARTHSILRAEAPRLIDRRARSSRAPTTCSCPEMPAQMFVTCLFVVLEPVDRPRSRSPTPATTCRTSAPRDGVDRAPRHGHAARPHARHRLRGDRGRHRPRRAACSSTPTASSRRTARAARCTASRACARRWPSTTPAATLLDRLLDELHAFTGPDVEQEDDITLVTLRRSAARRGRRPSTARGPGHRDDGRRARPATAGEPLLAFTIEGAIGNEREAMDRVAAAVAPLGLEPARLERLKTAVSEAAMNAIEYGSQGDPTVPVDVAVDADDEAIRVRVTDRALSGPVPRRRDARYRAKLAGEQKPRGWGLFLIRAHGRRDGRDADDGHADRDAHPRPDRALTRRPP